jgi:cell wall-associated NlpC family hydrolase
MSPAPRRALAPLALAVVGVLSLLTSGPAMADSPKNDARHRALMLADQVTELETQVEIAGENYAAQQASLGDVVRQQVLAQREQDEAQTGVEVDGREFRQKVRALYLTAGDVSILPDLLRGSSPQDVLSQLDTVQRVVRQQQRVGAGVQSRLAKIQASSARLERLADQRTELSRQADAAQAAIERLLANRQQALDEVSSEVRRYEQADMVAREAAAAARAAATLTAKNLPVSPDLPSPLPAASPGAATAIAAARAQLGKPYQYAGNGPNTFDCSGLTRWAYAAAGVSLPRTSRQQWGVGSHPALEDLRPGDLLFWATNVKNPATIHHVALYVGAGWMIQAPHTGDVVRFSRIYLDGYIGATRPPGV